MNQNVEDCNEVREQFRRSTVRIHIFRWGKNPSTSEEGWQPEINLPGIVTVSGSTFCHIIVCVRKFFPRGAPAYRYRVVFTDDTYVDFDVNTATESDWLAAFYVPTPAKKAGAVQISNQSAAWRDPVWVFGYDSYDECVLDTGSVTHIGAGKFDHDCPPNSYTSYGYPVFNLDKNLVGICYSDYGVTRAVDVNQMTYMLSQMVDGMDGKPLDVIINRIKVLGEATYGE